MANKFFIDDNLTLDKILNLIYFERYKFEELQEYILPALHTITDIKHFFQILFHTIKNFVEEKKKTFLKKC